MHTKRFRKLTGAQIVRRSLEEPLRQIAANAGEEGAVVVEKVLPSKDQNFGYNAETGVYEDLVKAGVPYQISAYF